MTIVRVETVTAADDDQFKIVLRDSARSYVVFVKNSFIKTLKGGAWKPSDDKLLALIKDVDFMVSW